MDFTDDATETTTDPGADRLAIVTGVGRRRSIGAGLAVGLAADGWNLVLNAWRPYDERLGYERTPDDPESIAAACRARGGPGDVTTDVDSWDRHFAVNARATWLLIKAFAEQLPVQEGTPEVAGRIVALTSDHSVHNLPYGASKGALDRIVTAAAVELADRGVRSNVINPGPIDTGWMTEDIRRAGAEATPAGRLGTPSDTADLVRFLFSPAGSWINGQLLSSNGGFNVG
jgi:3-oxoacyl-[acyl-carrier protein] reductase